MQTLTPKQEIQASRDWAAYERAWIAAHDIDVFQWGLYNEFTFNEFQTARQKARIAANHGIRTHFDCAGRLWLEDRWTRDLGYGPGVIIGAAWVPAPPTDKALLTWLGY